MRTFNCWYGMEGKGSIAIRVTYWLKFVPRTKPPMDKSIAEPGASGEGGLADTPGVGL